MLLPMYNTNRNTGGVSKQEVNSQNGQNYSNKLINYFNLSNNTDVDKSIHDTFSNIFNGIGCFKSTFSFQLKPDDKPYQVPPRHVAYALKKPFKEELEDYKKCTS